MEIPTYAAITGLSHYYGAGFLRPGQTVQLVKEPDNTYDEEAIAVMIQPLGKIGHIANSTNTVPRGCRSAGRIYDSFDQRASGIVRFVMKDTAIVELVPAREEVSVVKLELNMEARGKWEF